MGDDRVTISFDLNDEQRLFEQVVERWCRAREEEMSVLPPGEFVALAWGPLADLGIFSFGVGEEGGAEEILVAMRQLGRFGCPGPSAATFFAAGVLEGSQRDTVIAGTALACVATLPILPWGGRSGIWIEVDGERAWLAEPVGVLEPVLSGAGEPWARGTLRRKEELSGVSAARASCQIAAASYLVGAGLRQLEVTAAYAKDRRQFGRPIGDLQSVAHPIADAYVELQAAEALTAVAAAAQGAARATPEAIAWAHQAASRAALQATYVAHQAMGAIGFTNEGPLARHSLYIRQLAASPAVRRTGPHGDHLVVGGSDR